MFSYESNQEVFYSIINNIIERLEKDDYHSWDFINRLSKMVGFHHYHLIVMNIFNVTHQNCQMKILN
ncbi:hypothetical protein BANRA_03259 [Klebsiella pneumoniae]|nr:hypothetical protein BANRA_03259 [Klebsiella pneumoniae]